MSRLQINVRVEKELVDQIDERRVELRETRGEIPTRSDVIRLALEWYLKQPADQVAKDEDQPDG